MKKHERFSVSSITTIAAALCIAALLGGCSMTKANTGITDAEITSGVNANLGQDALLKPYSIVVATNDGVVHLSGNVATGTERDSAEKIAAASRGVVSVDNYIQFGNTAPVVR